MRELWNLDEEILGVTEGSVEDRSPGERFARTFQSICKWGKNSGRPPEKFPVKVHHAQEPL